MSFVRAVFLLNQRADICTFNNKTHTLTLMDETLQYMYTTAFCYCGVGRIPTSASIAQHVAMQKSQFLKSNKSAVLGRLGSICAPI